MQGGTYSGPLTLGRRRGRRHSYITLTAAPGASVTLRARTATGEGEGLLNVREPGCNALRAPSKCRPVYWRVHGLNIDGAGRAYYAVKLETGGLTLQGNTIHGSTDDVIKLVRSANDVVISHNDIFDSGGHVQANSQGIDMVGASHVRISHNDIHNISKSDGVYPKGGANHIVIADNEFAHIAGNAAEIGAPTGGAFVRDGKDGRRAHYATYNVVFRNNLILDTDLACIKITSSYNTRIYNNSCYGAAKAGHAGIFVAAEGVATGATQTARTAVPSRDLYIANNIIEVAGAHNPYVVEIYEHADRTTGPQGVYDLQTLHMDHNLYDVAGHPHTDAQFYWPRYFGAAAHGPLAAWRARTGEDRHSRDANPEYIGTRPGPDPLRITAHSPAALLGRRGPRLPCARRDYLGRERPARGGCSAGAYAAPATGTPLIQKAG